MTWISRRTSSARDSASTSALRDRSIEPAFNEGVVWLNLRDLDAALGFNATIHAAVRAVALR